MNIKDDRTKEQLESHSEVVLALDTAMTAWGIAREGKSYAGWSCRPQDLEKVYPGHPSLREEATKISSKRALGLGQNQEEASSRRALEEAEGEIS